MADTAAKIMVLCFPFGQPAPEICELGVKCNEKAGFPGSGFSRQGEIAPEETENEIPKKICTFMYERSTSRCIVIGKREPDCGNAGESDGRRFPAYGRGGFPSGRHLEELRGCIAQG
jgi:hypothetical protein